MTPESLPPTTPKSPVILSLSFAHPNVTAEDRERLTVPEDRLEEALRAVFDGPEELAVVSTCLRHEVFAVGATDEEVADVVRAMSGIRTLPSGTQVRYGRDSVAHLFRIAAGLCSPVVGEPEVLGQVRRAHRAALDAGTLGPNLDQVFREAIHSGRDAREALPEQDTGSVAAIAADHLLELPPGRLVLVGAGAMANSVAHRLHDTDWEVVRLTRTPERLGPDARGFEDLEAELSRADAAVTAVRSSKPLVDASMLRRIGKRRSRPLLLLDLGMPANIVREHVDGIEHADIDDIADDDRHHISAEEAEAIVSSRAVEVHARVVNSSLTPLIQALRDKASQAVGEELDRAYARLGDIDDCQREVIERMARTLSNRLMHDPMLYLSSHPEAVAQSDTARNILGIDEDAVEDQLDYGTDPEVSSAGRA